MKRLTKKEEKRIIEIGAAISSLAYLFLVIENGFFLGTFFLLVILFLTFLFIPSYPRKGSGLNIEKRVLKWIGFVILEILIAVIISKIYL